MDKPAVIRYQVHTVMLTNDKRQGAAFGVTAYGEAFRIWLLTPRAVEQALEQLKTVARSLKTHPQLVSAHVERPQTTATRYDREWSLR